MRSLGALVLLLPMLAGCLGSGQHAERPTQASWRVDSSFAVVGLVDAGINVYHEVFQDPDARLPPSIVDAETGQPPVPVALSTTGNATERFAHDKATWDNLKPKTLYWFVGTRVLGYAVTKPDARPIIYKDGSHGTGVASVVRNVSRDAWIVFVPGDIDILRDPLQVAHLGAEPAAGLRWLAAQSWVDVISLSLGDPGDPPVLWNNVARATRDAADAGIVVVAGAGDTPGPALQTGTAGPPWVISVGGAEPSAHGMASHASTIVDVVSDYTRRIALNGTDGYLNFSGTSFSAPLVAGVLAQSLIEVRGHARDASRAPGVLCTCDGLVVTAGTLRSALNASAEYWTAAQWEPLNYSNTGNRVVDLLLFMSEPVGPAPWLQMAWGYIGDHSWRTVAAALEGRPPPLKPMAAVQYMATQQALREAYWSTVPYATPG